MSIRDNPADLRDLERAVALLSATPVIIKISSAVGSSIEAGMKKLPGKAREAIHTATEKGLLKSIELAEKTLESSVQPAWSTSHSLAVAASGAVGGFFGFAGLIVEIPLTTTIMMRSIQDIARSEGHDITVRRTQLECLSVFSHGSKTNNKDDAADSGYYAGRAAMAELIGETAKSLGKIAATKGLKGISTSAAGQWLAKLIETIATRFGIVISEKAVLQSAPVVGALTGAAVNSLFMNFYQDVARGHFIVLRLEKSYGEEAVQAEFETIRGRLEAAIPA
jgi:hypothetical protein